MTDSAVPFPHSLNKRHLLMALVIVLAALLLRGGVLLQRAAADPDIIPVPGTDPYGYLNRAAGVLDGSFPAGAYYYHPGPAYVFAAIFALLGKELVMIYGVLITLDALTCGLLIGAGWLLTRRAAGGYIAGMAYALYPAAMFYATTALIAPQACFLLALLLFLALWQRDNFAWSRTLLMGLAAGWLSVSRINLLPVAGIIVLWWLVDAWWTQGQWRRRLAHSVLLVVTMLATIAPFTYSNYQQSGDFVFIATTGPKEIYWANNRDSAGRNEDTPAMQSIDTGYMQALRRDIQLAPEHFFGLQAFKFALFWHPFEPANNVNFYQAQEASPLLQAIPFTFTGLALLGLLGCSRLLYDDKLRSPALLVLVLVAWICLAYLVGFAYGRLRHPAIVPLALGCSGLALWIADLWQQREFRRTLRRVAVPALLLAVLFGYASWALTPPIPFPPERTYAALPDDAVAVNATFGEELTLVGWRVLPGWEASGAGFVETTEAYGVELFWQVQQSTEREYQFYMGYFDGDARYAALDRPIGAVSFPFRLTDTWSPGTIIGEIVAIRFDGDEPPFRSGRVDVGAYYWDDAGLIQNVAREDGQRTVTLQSLAVVPLDAPPTPEPLASVTDERTFAEKIRLRGVEFPSQAVPGETVTLRFQWEALVNVQQDYTLFVHLMRDDSTDADFMAQANLPPVPAWQTSNWVPGMVVESEVALTMPTEAGTYPLYAGLFNAEGRLATNAPDNRPLLGTITVSNE